MNVHFDHHVFQFKTPSGTSRGILTEKHAWFIEIEDQGKKGKGECSIIPGLSPDFESKTQYLALLGRFQEELSSVQLIEFQELKEFELLQKLKEKTNIYTLFGQYPSLIFGFETAVLDWSNGGKELFFDTPFSKGQQKIPINGLVWMGSPEFMKEQMSEKVEQGYNCIKMKVGAIDFDKEIELLSAIRANYSPQEMILRVDANGAFTSDNVREKLKKLADLGIHSIEQPISSGQHVLMAELCFEQILPIALDEELIGIQILAEKEFLLNTLQPQFIILKPSLHGGILGSQEWITLAEERNIDWWMTSALESNLGLACIAQFTGTFDINKHHGLGTGSLYVNNLPSRLKVENGMIFCA